MAAEFTLNLSSMLFSVVEVLMLQTPSAWSRHCIFQRRCEVLQDGSRLWRKMAIVTQTSVMSTVGVETVAAFLSRKFTSRACRGREEVSSQWQEQETSNEII